MSVSQIYRFYYIQSLKGDGYQIPHNDSHLTLLTGNKMPFDCYSCEI
jgi:hypothetical protein